MGVSEWITVHDHLRACEDASRPGNALYAEERSAESRLALNMMMNQLLVLLSKLF